MTKQQLLALLREAYKLSINQYFDRTLPGNNADEFIEEVERTNRVGDLELPVLESEWPDESRIDAIGQNGEHYALVPHEFYD